MIYLLVIHSIVMSDPAPSAPSGRPAGSKVSAPRLRGHRLPQSLRSHRHRPRAPSASASQKRPRVEGAEGSGPESGEAGQTASGHLSIFAQLRRTLTTPESVVEFLKKEEEKKKGVSAAPPHQQQREEEESKAKKRRGRKANDDVVVQASVWTDPKLLLLFLHAGLSGRDDAFYSALMAEYKPLVFDLLFTTYSLCTTVKMPLRPVVHEFVIRCEQHGVKGTRWLEDLTQSGARDTSLLTPKMILKKLALLDPVGRLQRLIEMSCGPEDVQKCAHRLQKLILSSADGASSPIGGGDEAEGDSDHRRSVTGTLSPKAEEERYAAHCRLLSKLLSRIRRIAADCSGVCGNKSGKHKALSQGRAEEEEEESHKTREGEEGEEQGARLTADMIPWDEAQCEAVRDSVAVLVELLDFLTAHKPSTSTQSPATKVQRFVEWGVPLGLVREEEARRLTSVTAQAEEELSRTAAQMEVVLRLKALPAGETAALGELLDELWSEEEGRFEPYSSDVLSCVATAAGHAGIEESLQKSTARRLVSTQRVLEGTGKFALPRRAARFVSGILQKEKQIALAKHIKKLQEDEAAS